MERAATAKTFLAGHQKAPKSTLLIVHIPGYQVTRYIPGRYIDYDRKGALKYEHVVSNKRVHRLGCGVRPSIYRRLSTVDMESYCCTSGCREWGNRGASNLPFTALGHGLFARSASNPRQRSAGLFGSPRENTARLAYRPVREVRPPCVCLCVCVFFSEKVRMCV